jgi:hypothetical protein
MTISLDLEFIASLDLSPSEYVILYCIYNGKNPKDVLCCVPDSTYAMIAGSGYLRENPHSDWNFPYSLTGDGLALFERTDTFSSFAEEYRNLFPKGIKSGNGTPIRGDKQGVIKKMEWFLRTYPEFSKSTIIAATKLYIDQMRQKGYVYMTQADYLIQKDNGSKLAALCEEFDNKTSHIIKSGERRI